MSVIAILARLSWFFGGGEKFLGGEFLFAKKITFFIYRLWSIFISFCNIFHIDINVYYVCEKLKNICKNPGPIFWTVVCLTSILQAFLGTSSLLISKGKKSHKKPFKFEKNVELWRLIFYPISGNEIKTFWDLLHKLGSVALLSHFAKCINRKRKNQKCHFQILQEIAVRTITNT